MTEKQSFKEMKKPSKILRWIVIQIHAPPSTSLSQPKLCPKPGIKLQSAEAQRAYPFHSSFQEHLSERQSSFSSSLKFSDSHITATVHKPLSLDMQVLLSLVALLVMGVIYVEHWTKCFLLSVPAQWSCLRGDNDSSVEVSQGTGHLLVFLIRVLPCQFHE